MLFTKWPSIAVGNVSCTNLIGPVSLIGITCLLCSHARLAMYGKDRFAQQWWQHTTTARKVFALAYYSSVSFVVSIVLGTLLILYLRKQFQRKQVTVLYSETTLYVLDGVFTTYIVTQALVNQASLYILVYFTYYTFLRMYFEIKYMFSHFYFLALFSMLSQHQRTPYAEIPITT